MADYATLLRDHITLTCRSIDRIFLQAYVPKLQSAGQVCTFLHRQRGFPIPSSAAFGQIGEAYVAEIPRWAKDNGFRLLAQVALSTGLWVGTYLFCRGALIEGEHGRAARIALSAIGIAGFLPWVYVVGKSILAQDEFSQRIHFIALSIAFAAIGIGSFACGFLRNAGLVPELPFSDLWIAMVIVWWLSMFATSRYYR